MCLVRPMDARRIAIVSVLAFAALSSAHLAVWIPPRQNTAVKSDPNPLYFRPLAVSQINNTCNL